MHTIKTVAVAALCTAPSIAINCTHALPNIPNAAAAGGFVVLAACSPFVLRHALKRRELSLVIISLIAFTVTAGFNLANALGSAADQRAERTGSRAGAAGKARLLKEELAQLESKRTAQISASGPLSKKVEIIDKQASLLRSQLAQSSAADDEASIDPQSSNIASVLSVAGVKLPASAIGTALNVWFALGLEILGSLGPIIFSTLMEGAPGQEKTPQPAPAHREEGTAASAKPRGRGKARRDPIKAFIKDMVTIKAGAEATAAAVFLAYGEWCQANGEKPLTATGLGRALGSAGWTRTKRGGVARYAGVELKALRNGEAAPAIKAPLRIVKA